MTSYRETKFPRPKGTGQLKHLPQEWQDYLKRRGAFDGTEAGFQAWQKQVVDNPLDEAKQRSFQHNKLHHFELNVKNSNKLPDGILLAYFPQPFETEQVCTATLKVLVSMCVSCAYALRRWAKARNLKCPYHRIGSTTFCGSTTLPTSLWRVPSRRFSRDRPQEPSV